MLSLGLRHLVPYCALLHPANLIAPCCAVLRLVAPFCPFDCAILTLIAPSCILLTLLRLLAAVDFTCRPLLRPSLSYCAHASLIAPQSPLLHQSPLLRPSLPYYAPVSLLLPSTSYRPRPGKLPPPGHRGRRRRRRRSPPRPSTAPGRAASRPTRLRPAGRKGGSGPGTRKGGGEVAAAPPSPKRGGRSSGCRRPCLAASCGCCG